MPKNHIHGSTSWEWKVRVSLNSSNTLQCPKIAYMYILEVESSRFFPFDSSNLLQYPKIAYKYILGVEILRFFPFLQYIKMPKNYMYHVHSVSGKVIFFLLLQNINYTSNAQKLHACKSWKWRAHFFFFFFFFFQFLQNINYNARKVTCPSWEWKVRVSFHSSNLLQCQKSRTCTSWKWKANVS